MDRSRFVSGNFPVDSALFRRLIAVAKKDRLTASYFVYGISISIVAIIGVGWLPFRSVFGVICDAIPFFRSLAAASSDPDAYRTHFGICISFAGIQTPVAILEMSRRQRAFIGNRLLPSLLVSSLTISFVLLMVIAEVPIDFATVKDVTQRHRIIANVVLTSSVGLATAGSFLITSLLIFTNWAFTPISYVISKTPIQKRGAKNANE